MQRFWTFKLSSDDIFWQLFWLLFPNFGQFFFHSSGHPGARYDPLFSELASEVGLLKNKV